MPKSQKGTLTVEPIRKEKDIAAIKRLLSDRPRDLLLFVLGINNGLRAVDLLRLKVGQVRYLKAGESIQVIERKTGKQTQLMMNKSSRKALDAYLADARPDDEDFLFRSRQGGNRALHTVYVGQLIRSWARAINLKGRYGNHTLRKTWGYIQRTKFGTSWAILTKRLNHSSPKTTMVYLGVEDGEVNDALLHEI